MFVSILLKLNYVDIPLRIIIITEIITFDTPEAMYASELVRL